MTSPFNPTSPVLSPAFERAPMNLGAVRCAALLNANARRVNRRARAQIDDLLPGDVHMSHSQEEAEAILGELIDAEYEIIFAGGGDGTIVHLFNALARQLAARGIDPMEGGPLVGLLPMGTGNAMAAHFGSGSATGDLGLMASGAPLRMAPLRMLTCNGQLFPFAGVGVDSMLLNDYIAVKRRAEDTPLASMFSGMTGYMAALFTRTLPSLLDPRYRNPRLRMINTGGQAFRVDARTREVIETFEPGAELYSGEALMVAGSTISCYGFNLKLFPMTEQRADRFQVRLYSGPALKPAIQMPRLFDGTFHDRDLYDFLVDGVHIELETPAPYQLAGDAMGMRKEIDWTLSPHVLPVALPDRSLIH